MGSTWVLITMSGLFCVLILKLGPEVVFGNSTAGPVKGKSQDAFVVCSLFMALGDYVLDERQERALEFSPEYQQKATGKCVL